MLHLHSLTPDRWFEQVESQLEPLLLDHAHCEKKAAGTAMNLIFAYVDRTDFVRALKEIVVEELEHFQQVLDLIAARGMKFRRLPPGSYGALSRAGPQTRTWSGRRSLPGRGPH